MVDGGSVTLSCDSASTSIPSAAYVWKKDGTVDATQTSQTWAINTASFSSAGVYKCSVSASGTASAESADLTLGGKLGLL